MPLPLQIAEDYRVNWIVDNLPAATRVVEPASGGNPARIITIYERGFPLGFKGGPEIGGTVEGSAYLYNHHRLVFKYHIDASFDGARLVGFEVEPFSVKHKLDASGKLETCSKLKPVTHDMPPQEAGPAESVTWTYDVRWEYSDVKWASRWDAYLRMPGGQVHWFSIINSMLSHL